MKQNKTKNKVVKPYKKAAVFGGFFIALPPATLRIIYFLFFVWIKKKWNCQKTVRQSADRFFINLSPKKIILLNFQHLKILTVFLLKLQVITELFPVKLFCCKSFD
jgi:hypothetical protein